jgi:hypothetical protein
LELVESRRFEKPTGFALGELFVVHLDGFDFSGNTGGGKGHNHTGLDDSGLDTTDLED